MRLSPSHSGLGTHHPPPTLLPQGDTCYVLEKGELIVKVGGEEKDRIHPGELFGELAVLYNVPRTATIEAATECTLYGLQKSSFENTLESESIAKRTEILTFVRSCTIFASLDARASSRLADVVELRTYEAGEHVIAEGEQADAMYLIREGQAVVKQESADAEGKPILRNLLKQGDYFGERALLTDEKRSATVEAVSSLECLRIGRDAFLKLLGPLHTDLTSQMPADASPKAARLGAARAGAPADLPPNLVSQPRRYAPKMRELTTVKPLGSGGYAQVSLVRSSSNRCYCELTRAARTRAPTVTVAPRFWELPVAHACRSDTSRPPAAALSRTLAHANAFTPRRSRRAAHNARPLVCRWQTRSSASTRKR